MAVKTYKVTYYKVGIMGRGRWEVRDVEAETYTEARQKAGKWFGFRNVKSIEWSR